MYKLQKTKHEIFGQFTNFVKNTCMSYADHIHVSIAYGPDNEHMGQRMKLTETTIIYFFYLSSFKP